MLSFMKKIEFPLTPQTSFWLETRLNFANRLEGKSWLRVSVFGTADAPFTLIRIEKFETDAAVCLRLGLPSMDPSRNRKGAFR